MNVIQTEFKNYCYNDDVCKEVKLVRWWVLAEDPQTLLGGEKLKGFDKEEEKIFTSFMNNHPSNFSMQNRSSIPAKNFDKPSLVEVDQETDIEKPCLLIIGPHEKMIRPLNRRMYINLQNKEGQSALPFIVLGEIIPAHDVT